MLLRFTIIISTLIATALAATNFALLFSNKVQQLVTSSSLVWQSFTGDPKQLEYAVQAAKYVTEDENYPLYVCRALMDGIYISGNTQKHAQQTVCIVSMYMDVRSHYAFDVLLNKGHGGKLTWKSWSKYSAGIPSGAVSATSAGHVDDYYIARRKTQTDKENTEHHHHHLSRDFSVGRFAPKLSLGKVIVNEGREENEYEDGQILVEEEPIRYELRDIKIDKIRKQIFKNVTLLGSTILANDEENSNLIETVISYQFDKVQYWGTLEGASRGLPTKVYETGKPTTEFNWGLKETLKRIDTKAVSTTLQPGTAINVTLSGTYTRIEAPYKATLVSFYQDTNDSESRRIESFVQTADMEDLKFEFSPVYWRHNFTLVPTTTTTTTTTTSTTTPSTTTSKEIQPAFPPPIVDDEMENGNGIAADQSRESVTEDKIKVGSVGGSNKDKANGGDRIQQQWSVIAMAVVSFAWFIQSSL